jgi:hypothetical protein
MTAKNHDVESMGAKPRDHARPRHHFLKHAHRDWRVWVVTVLMIVLVLVYVLTDNLSIRPGERAVEPMPAANLP